MEAGATVAHCLPLPCLVCHAFMLHASVRILSCHPCVHLSWLFPCRPATEHHRRHPRTGRPSDSAADGPCSVQGRSLKPGPCWSFTWKNKVACQKKRSLNVAACAPAARAQAWGIQVYPFHGMQCIMVFFRDMLTGSSSWFGSIDRNCTDACSIAGKTGVE